MAGYCKFWDILLGSQVVKKCFSRKLNSNYAIASHGQMVESWPNLESFVCKLTWKTFVGKCLWCGLASLRKNIFFSFDLSMKVNKVTSGGELRSFWLAQWITKWWLKEPVVLVIRETSLWMTSHLHQTVVQTPRQQFLQTPLQEHHLQVVTQDNSGMWVGGPELRDLAWSFSLGLRSVLESF